MGRLLLVCRLAANDVRHHLAQALLLVVAIAAATATLTMGLALHGVTSHPYHQTRAATRGPDVVAYTQSPTQAEALTHARGVTAHSGPYPMVDAVLHFRGITAGTEVEGRSQTSVAVDQPKLTSGNWVRPGGVVIERTFAEALGATVGSKITIAEQPFTVNGIAVTAAIVPYPNICYSGCYVPPSLHDQGIGAKQIGLIWTTEADVIKLTSAAGPVNNYVLNLKLRDPAQAPAFASRYSTGTPTSPHLNTWQDLSSSYGLLVQDEQTVLVPGAVLLALLAIASVAVLVGSRLAEYTRRVGLLKAVGASPSLVAATFLTENLVLALIAATVGLVAGLLIAPLLTSPGAAVVGTAGAPSLTPLMVVGVVAMALVVVLVSTLVPALRAARTSTVSALADAARPPKRRGRLVGISSRLPVPGLFGLRLVARRPRRALLSAASIAVTVMGVVAVLAFHANVATQFGGGHSGDLANPVVNRDEQMLFVVTVTLVTLAVLTVIVTAWATVLDARRASAVIRSLGATPRQVRAGLVTAQVLSALPGAILGVPLGIGLFKLASRDVSGLPSALWLVAAVVGTLLVVASLTSVPARIGTRRPVAEILQAEAA
jgi:ABC-type lipoprotein release transport system permease subunit